MRIRAWMGLVLVCLLGVPTWGQPPPRALDEKKAQVVAATGDAVQELYRQIARQPLTAALTVHDLLDATDGKRLLITTLQRAQQLGGPRWVDQYTCQIKLSIPGAQVVAALAKIAASNPRTTPIDAERLLWTLQDWDQRTFVATGTSTGAAAVDDLAMPRAPLSAWSAVEEDERRQLISLARADAVQRAVRQIEPIPLTDHSTVADALNAQSGALRTSVAGYLATSPVTGVEFGEDLRVRLTLAPDADGTFQVFRAGAQDLPNVSLPPDEPAWNRVHRAFEQRLEPVVGTGQPSDRPTTTRAASIIPTLQQPPEWISGQLSVAGTATDAGSKLGTARLADRHARAELTQDVLRLPLTDSLTIGQAVAEHPELVIAVQRAVAEARVYKTAYHSDGTVETKIALDLRDLWRELVGEP